VAIAHYRGALATREAELAAAEAELAPWARREPLAGPVARLGCYRGIAELGGLTLTAEIVDWRRFAAARAFMSCTGLVPSEYSSGERTRRGRITKAGSEPVRTTLIEAAWACQHAPAIGATLRRRQVGADPGTLARSWKAQRRLNGRYRHLTSHGKGPGRGNHRGRPRARRVRLGRDDRLTARDLPEPVAHRDARRGRNDPRPICERTSATLAPSEGHHPAG
jgi:hypothetical protein